MSKSPMWTPTDSIWFSPSQSNSLPKKYFAACSRLWCVFCGRFVCVSVAYTRCVRRTEIGSNQISIEIDTQFDVHSADDLQWIIVIYNSSQQQWTCKPFPSASVRYMSNLVVVWWFFFDVEYHNPSFWSHFRLGAIHRGCMTLNK